MRKLVVYYSLEGNTKFIAEQIADEIKGDLLELIPEKDIPRKGFMKYFWGGKLVHSKEKPKLQPLSKNASDYDFLVIGTPVWAWNFTPALATFFSNVNLTNKKIAIFCCHGGGPGKTLIKMAAALKGNDIIGGTHFMDPLKHNNEQNAKKAREWIRNLLK